MKKKQENDSENIEYEELVSEDAGSASTSAKIKKLREDLKECQKGRTEYLTGWQRAKADLINERKEYQEREKEIGTAVRERFLMDLLPALDSFDMAFANKKAWEKVDKNWRSGVEYIHSQLLSTIAQHGFVPFNPAGEIFNPTLHESIEMVLVSKKEQDNKIIEILQCGYKHGDAVVRPAKVKVGTYKKSAIT